MEKELKRVLPIIRSLCFEKKRTLNDVDDLISYVFYRIALAYAQFDGRGNMGAWLIYKAKFAIKDYIREAIERGKEHRLYNNPFEVPESEVPDLDFEDWDQFNHLVYDLTNPTETQDLVLDINKVLSHLKTTHSTSLKMAYMGYSHREIGEKLGVSEGAVGQYIYNGKRKAKKKLIEMET